ncbi:hypothetical protein DDE82_006710 [Stemphylium lycopersici]|uniref:Uncharacterized protein n=1 Tax=Stemphylium lycopersici TaxID=183478 RepID=A0A364MVD1_STELY|nr:hypothetical protein TW65_08448 [Stemphylium lycopersici]RAR01138.1 hypothetical protein DDE82_006710 [Stemphylium lycopersici]RAR04769.1 hypothetical protein DDE83_007671 [Stemphylium lycopersici]
MRLLQLQRQSLIPRRDHIPDAEEDKTSDSSANLYSLRIDLASEGYISVYVPNITALTFCESSIAVWLEDSMESELHLAVQGSTKTVSIPVGKGHANSFCSHYLRAEGIGAASDGPAGKEKSLDLGLVSTTRETSSSEGPLVTLTTFSEPALSRKNNSLKAVKLSPSKTSTASSTKIRLSIDESDDEPEAPETVRHLSETEHRYDLANEAKGQVISTAAPQETWKHASFYAYGQDYPEEYEPSFLGGKGKHADIYEEESFSGSKNEDFGYDTGPTENADESLPAADEADGIPFEDKAAVSTEAGAMAENEEFTANPAPQDSAHDDPLDPSTTTISPHTHATPLPSASQTSRLNIPTLAADISFTFPSPNLAPPPTPTPAPLLPPPLFPLQFEGQHTIPIIWDPSCPQISTSTILLPSNEETPVPVTMGMGCWKIVASPTSPGLPNAPSVTTGADLFLFV